MGVSYENGRGGGRRPFEEGEYEGISSPWLNSAGGNPTVHNGVE
jgi:hypothetical protein